MECLKQVSPAEWEDVPILRQFVDDLPKNPYCTNSKGFTYIRNKQNAIRHRYIQPNHPAICKWLWFDVDDVDAMYSWSNANLPPPQIIVKIRKPTRPPWLSCSYASRYWWTLKHQSYTLSCKRTTSVSSSFGSG